MNDEDTIFKFEDNEIIIPSIVWEELNNKKDNSNPSLGYLSRRVLRLLTELADVRPLREGIRLKELPEKSEYYSKAKDLNTLIRVDYKLENDEVDKSFLYRKNDYKIISCAKNNPGSILVTSDIALLGIAKDFVNAEEYKADNVKEKVIYKGYRIETVQPDVVDDLYTNKEMEDIWELYPNEFIILIDVENDNHKGIGIKKKEKIKLVNFDKELNFSRMKVRPANLEQKMLLYLLQDPEILCVTVTGISGKGKTLISCDYAFSEVEKGKYSKLLYTKSIIPTDEDEYMGFNKGSEDEKFSSHIKALFTAIEFLYKDEIYNTSNKKTLTEKVEELISQDNLGTLPLANIRGMNIYKKIVMLDEAQNTKKHIIKSLITRLTDESKIIVLGDIEQIDDPKLNMYNNGLSHLIDKGKTENFIGHIMLDIDKGNSKRGKLSTFGAKKL